ncbi:polysaccharide deacetylase [Lacrimispora sp. 210928-DFI.3.58]|uniref:polysaccharide deacetylase n=1 Tax=Lacrimispora sp. 210928-DFI.3.58 TaxID=2883214 RepID=UPI001D08DF0F|nr:polysaccharide deacetylase [Lacrimispora sp. 210928-DFI.3.58]MCB7319447.1 polysaccharide deacetylase [Lacrimispora sp. 210928-DFI.3.58]
MSRSDYRRRQARRRRQKFARLSRHLPTFIVLLIITVLTGALLFGLFRFVLKKQPQSSVERLIQAEGGAAGKENGAHGSSSGSFGGSGENGNTGASGPDETNGSGSAPSSREPQDEVDRLIAQADRIAMGYDYDGAAALLTEEHAGGIDLSDSRIQAALTRYETEKAALVPADMQEITHIFFHSLIMDNAKAFDGDKDAANYNSVMTTKAEFLKILEAMYQKGYVLVRLHDIACESTGADGQTSFSWGNIMLPEGKKPFVMSQDDVCYYPYMEGDGFASRIVIGEDGKPTCEMVMDDGSVSIGSYDLIPLLEDFIEEHPDFSYKGARAVIAFTGYEGILGYRTASSYSSSPTYEEDRQSAAQVAQCLRDNGWELASHSWGHLQLGVAKDPEEGFAISEERFRTDTDKWEAEVESLIGPTDILLYPFGNDISDWHAYSQDNSRFTYLYSKGFRYFCNVDASKPCWVQKGSTYLRMARRNLDGYRLYEDMVQTDPAKKRLTDLFEAADIFDPARPTPVTWSY